jgi:hypothetical protein
MEKIRTLLIIIVSILIGVFGYMVYQSTINKPLVPAQNKIIEPSVTSEPIISPLQAEPSQITWPTYSSTPLGFSINHPDDLQPKKQEETIVFSKWGPSQKEATEFYDGISLTFSAGFYNGTFESLVNQQLEEVKNWPTFVSATNIKALVMAGKEAYSFEAVTMGKATYYFIKKNQTEYFKIVDATNDPTSQGFNEVITRMLESLKLN